MMFPLVRDLAADPIWKIPVAVTCRVLGFSKQAYYAWRAAPVTDRDWSDAHLINSAIDIHHDDPEFGYRFITDELARAGVKVSRNRVNRLCSQQRLWSVHARKRGLSRRPGPPVHGDLVRREFTAPAPNRLWLTDITEHPTSEGTLYLCAVKDACSRRIVGYSIGGRMTSQLAVDALRNAVALRAPAGTTVHSDRGAQFPFPRLRPGPARRRAARIDGTGRCLRRQRRHGIVLRPAAEERPEPAPAVADPRPAPPRNSGLDRTDLPPPTPPRRPWTAHPNRIRDTPPDRPRGLTALPDLVNRSRGSPES